MREHRDEFTFLHLQRYGKHARGSGWYSFDRSGMHFVGLIDVLHYKAGGLSTLGSEQLKWLEADVKGLSASTPVVVFTHSPWSQLDPLQSWDTAESTLAAACLERFESVFVLDSQIN